MTLYIVLSSIPDMVKRYDNVGEVLADRESGTIYFEVKVRGRRKARSHEYHYSYECYTFTGVTSVESN